MGNDKVVSLAAPAVVEDALTELPRTGARRLIEAAASGADLWVAASTSESELSPGEAFDLTATVGNGGRRSSNAAITTADAEVGTDAVAALGAGGASRESASLNEPATPGTYDYGACVVALPHESDTTNNRTPSLGVTVQ